MQSISLIDMAAEKLTLARQAHSGRAAHTIHGGHDHELRQTVLALAAGHELTEHDNPGEATLQVLQAKVPKIRFELPQGSPLPAMFGEQ